jgi:hypothetical protein
MKRVASARLTLGFSQALDAQAVDSLVVRGSRWRMIGPGTVESASGDHCVELIIGDQTLRRTLRVERPVAR